MEHRFTQGRSGARKCSRSNLDRFRNAFDMVLYEKLLVKLEEMEISTRIVKRIRN